MNVISGLNSDAAALSFGADRLEPDDLCAGDGAAEQQQSGRDRAGATEGEEGISRSRRRGEVGERGERGRSEIESKHGALI